MPRINYASLLAFQPVVPFFGPSPCGALDLVTVYDRVCLETPFPASTTIFRHRDKAISSIRRIIFTVSAANSIALVLTSSG
jgi:hypothetical protein